MNRSVRNQTRACALLVALAASLPAFSNEGLHITTPPPSVNPSAPDCKGGRIPLTFMEVKFCRTLYTNTTPNGAIAHTHIYAHVEYPLLPNEPSPNGPRPDSYVLWRMEVIQGTKILLECNFNGLTAYLKHGDIRKCVQGVNSNISSPVYLRVVWHGVDDEDAHINTF